MADGVVALAVDLGPGLAPADAVRAFRDEPGLVCLWGAWAGGGAVIASRPVERAGPGFAFADRMPRVAEVRGAPVVGGGWLGWLGYDLRRALEAVPERHPSAALPADGMAWYDSIVSYDGSTRRWAFEALVAPGREEALERRRVEVAAVLAGPAPAARPFAVGPLEGQEEDGYLAAVEEAIGRIRAGDLFQVNVCTRAGASFEGHPADLFAAAAERLRPAYGALVVRDAGAVVSLSPELFLRREGRVVHTSPIKGTRRRSGGAADAVEADRLRRSAKDAAENVMIVDLMRNDLGRVSEVGTVAVEGLLAVEPHPGVWHLVSTVRGTLAPWVGDAALLAATFPPGSVTGAPKVEAMRVADVVEARARGVYTGAVGLVSPLAGLELSVAIRSFEVADGRLELGVGGGITVDSVPAEEWREVGVKAAPLLAAAGSGVWPGEEGSPARPFADGSLRELIPVVAGRPVRLADHLARLDRSCREVLGVPSPEGLAALVAEACTAAAVSVVVGESGFAVEAVSPPTVAGALHLVSEERPRALWRHAWAADRRTPSSLLVSGGRWLLGTGLGNLFVVADGGFVTAPLRDDVLPGVLRRAVLDAALALGIAVQLRVPGRDELGSAFSCSELDGLLPVASVDGAALRPPPAGLLAAVAARLGGAASGVGLLEPA